MGVLARVYVQVVLWQAGTERLDVVRDELVGQLRVNRCHNRRGASTFEPA